VTGALLVGGASRRYGSPKALAPFRGTTLAEHAWAQLAWCEERLALGKAADRIAVPFPVLDDGVDARAPIAGVVAALRAARHDLCLLLPVDMPLVDERVLRELASRCEGDADCAVPATGPLPGAYRRRALPVLERALAEGRLGLRRALAELAVATAPIEADLLVNVNTAEDLPI
jgi:molybdopterin-guanine dinucleotide biosynthesis protein A